MKFVKICVGRQTYCPSELSEGEVCGEAPLPRLCCKSTIVGLTMVVEG